MMLGFSQKKERSWEIGVFAACIVVAMTITASSEPRSANQIRNVEVGQNGGKTIVSIQGSKRPNFTAFKLKSPQRLIIDIADSYVRGIPAIIEKHTPLIGGVAVSEYSVKGQPVCRVMINFKKNAAYRVRVKGNRLVASLSDTPRTPEGKVNASPIVEDALKAAKEADLATQRAEEEATRAKERAENAERLAAIETKRIRAEAASASIKAKAEARRARSDAAKARDEAAEARRDAELARKEAEIAKRRAARLAEQARMETEQAKVQVEEIREEVKGAIARAELEKQKAREVTSSARAEVEEARKQAAREAKKAEVAIKDAERKALRAKEDAEKARREAEARAEKEKRKAEKAKQLAHSELNRTRQEIEELKRREAALQTDLASAVREANISKQEVEKARSEARNARASYESALRNQQKKDMNAGEFKAKKLREAERAISKFRALVADREQQVLQEKQKREQLEERVALLSGKLETTESATKHAEAAFADAKKEALVLKREAVERATTASDAQKSAEAALIAQKLAAANYEKAARDEKQRLLKVLQQKENDTVESKRRLELANAKRLQTEQALKGVLESVAIARRQAEEAARAQSELEARTKGELARWQKRVSEAEGAMSRAFKDAQNARNAEARATARVDEIRERAEKMRSRAEREADERVAEAKKRLMAAELARESARKKQQETKKLVARLQTKAREAESQSDDLRKRVMQAESSASKASARAREIEKDLVHARKVIADQEKKIAAMAKRETLLAERKKAALAEQKKAALVAERKKAALAEQKKAALVAEQKKAASVKKREAGPVKSVKYKTKDELTQEEQRLWRLAKLKGEKLPVFPREEAPPPLARRKTEVKDIDFKAEGESQKLVVTTTNPIVYSTTTNDSGKATMILRSAELAPILQRTLDVTDFGGLISKVSSFQKGSDIHIDVGVERPAKNSISQSKNVIEWTFQPKKLQKMEKEGEEKDTRIAGLSHARGTKTRTIARESRNAYAYPFERTAALSNKNKKKGLKRYRGRHIDLDFKDADIHNILRLLADVGRVNIITSDDVKGSVTIRMRDVAWDHALDVILQAKNLGMIRDGNLIRVAPEGTLEKERELEIARRKQQIQLEPLETRLIPVSYAVAGELQPQAANLMSDRGSLAVDTRTNVIIARDTRGGLDQVEALIRNLDTQTPQVLIESRIVEATSQYSREIGIQWGGDFTASSATGNPTGLAFPSSVGVAGGATDAQTPVAGLTTLPGSQTNPNFAVNLPAAVGTGSGGALGITLGSIANNANLSLRLSAMEETGSLRILSSPKILTLDNREAHIEQGTLIPYSQVSAQGVQTSFKEAKLNLTVTPHVTADGSVLIKMRVMRDEPDFNNTGARGDPTILKREAETELLVSDGHTAVIGGIFTRNHGTSYKKVPFFGDIPILGWLFKNRSDSDRRSEMLIFITPRIVNRAESIGQ